MDNGKTLNAEEIVSQQKNEENTKLKYITPAILDKWKDINKVIMEYYFTDGRIMIGNDDTILRNKPKKVDYLLLYEKNIPIALVEAKGIEHSSDEGYQQAVEYATLLDVPFAYASNGKEFIERDMITGTNRIIKMEEFPTPNELWQRYKIENTINEKEEEIYLQPYHTSYNGKEPRYYQRIAINKAISTIASGRDRVLLVMATGTGKTYTAFQIIYRFWKTKSKKKILFLADRNILVDQTMRNDFRPFEKVMTKIEGGKITTEYQVYLSLYQQLKNADRDNYRQLPQDFFDLIIIDECHRGSASESSNWHDILEYFKSATQIGLTATPKETEDTSNANYFGEPVYTYSLKQGIEDGFLAPYRVISVELDIDRDGYRPPEGMLDTDGEPIEDRVYEQRDFDRTIIVEERRQIVAKRISDYLKDSGNRYSKTIVFCEDIKHAETMKRLLENENPELVIEDSRYVMKITGDDEVGKAQLDNFIDPTSQYPVIVVTSRLMSTGVDVQTCEVIVLDRVIDSMTEFKQIIGRGTRIKENYEIQGVKHSKTYFTILDFRKNYLKFKDPEFDGEPVVVTNVPEGKDFPKNNLIVKSSEETKKLDINKKIAHINGVEVEIVNEYIQYLDENGHLVKENIDSCIRNNILSQYPTYEDFKTAWLDTTQKTVLADELLLNKDYSDKLEKSFNTSIDKFDLIVFLAYDKKPISKEERIKNIGISEFLESYEEKGKELIKLILKTYVNKDFETIRIPKIFDLPEFQEIGWTTVKAIRYFGGKSEYKDMLNKLENKLYIERG